MGIILTENSIELPTPKECENCIHYWLRKGEALCTADNGIEKAEFVCDDFEE